ncbi:MAG: Thiosulfate reductase cytochrome b subunit [Thermodesulfobacterium sp.]|uniref:Thiosulfate reductase cytochrome b subunit n=1 Tax=Candidatus Thermodesulfobacterium syntrophicum TaxID=3060442 RepID=A0AAE3P417_9BACT|nr:Thiosulfate reductase cytochrome b subunit [Candidatus Thermodesulfobacterium syntrophicum]
MKKVYLHPIPVRIWHWVNAICFIILIITGLQIRLGDKLGLMSFQTAVKIHSWLGFVLIANYFIWFIYYFATLKFFKIYLPPFWRPIEFTKKALRQAKYYGYGIMVGDKNPHHPTPDNKFNPLQQVAYFLIMIVCIPLQLITGLILWDPVKFQSLGNLLGGIQIVSLIHVGLWIFFAAFIIVHFYLATLGHTVLAHIIAMFTGYEEEHEEH